MIFSKTSTETIPSKKPKNPETNAEIWSVNEKFLVKVECYISLEMS